ncbi:MAG: hypothetical protein U9P44_00220 [archaeon]|nr:hypothetical protein [archaeon]
MIRHLTNRLKGRKRTASTKINYKKVLTLLRELDELEHAVVDNINMTYINKTNYEILNSSKKTPKEIRQHIKIEFDPKQKGL